MNRIKFNQLALKVVDKLPVSLQRLIFKIVIRTRFILFKMKYAGIAQDATNPETIYWISTNRIMYLTNYVVNKNAETIPIADRIFSEKMRGKVVDGEWDKSAYKFTDLEVYQAYEKRLLNGAKWEDTDYYKGILKKIETGDYVWGLQSKADLNKRCEYLDWLYENIKNKGYTLNRNNYDKNTTFDEIDVNIGRNGEYLFQDGRHRLSIAKILGVKQVPVMVFVRHKEWQKFREFVISYGKHSHGGALYQPLVHPDLADIPYHLHTHDYERLMETIKIHLKKKANGVMLDIGTNTGFFCHKFEDLGYKCYGVEQDPATFKILEKVKIAENKKFEVINASIFDVDIVRNKDFDVVLALNIFHHFLKRKTLYFQLINLLENLRTSELFFEPHLTQEDQMKDAYINYTDTEFIDFILQHSSLTQSEAIYKDKDGRIVFHLTK